MEIVSTREKSKVEKKSTKQLVTAPMPHAQGAGRAGGVLRAGGAQ